MSTPGGHFFVGDICEKCSIREKDSVRSSYQFCTDELKRYVLLCDPEKRQQIESIYSTIEEDRSFKLFQILQYRTVDRD
jgi:hypothetical protein